MSYVVCDGCGYWHGWRDDVDPVSPCPECGTDAAWAFEKVENALQYQHGFEHRVSVRFPSQFWHDVESPPR